MDLLAWIHVDAQARHWIEGGGYGALFILLFGCGLGLPLPEDVPIITAGVLIAQHHMHLMIAAPVAWLGILAGDCVLYRMGYHFGHNITRVPFVGKHVTVARIKRAEILFDHYGVLVVGVGRMFAGIRGAMVIAAGTIRFKFIKFLIADGLGAIVSGGVFMILGMWFGANIEKMHHLLHDFRIGISIGGIILGIALIFYIRWRAKKHKTIGDVLLKEVQILAESTHSGDTRNEP